VSFWEGGRSKGWCAVRLATTVRCEVGALGFTTYYWVETLKEAKER